MGRDGLPKPEDFSKALYMFDIGQNDLDAGFRKMSYQQILADIPNIITLFADAVRVCSSQLSVFGSCFPVSFED